MHRAPASLDTTRNLSSRSGAKRPVFHPYVRGHERWDSHESITVGEVRRIVSLDVGAGVAGLKANHSGRFEVQEQLEDGCCTLRLWGELDLATAPALYEVLAGLAADGTCAVTLDLGELHFMDSSGIKAILEVENLCTTRGYDFKLLPGRPQVQRVLELTGLLDRLPFEPTLRATK